jgi:hypothetical protein
MCVLQVAMCGSIQMWTRTQTMYTLNKKGEIQIGKLDKPVSNGYEGQELMIWEVEAQRTRPWYPFDNHEAWPVPSIDEVAVGAPGRSLLWVPSARLKGHSRLGGGCKR